MMKRILRIYVNQKLFLGLIAVLCITMTYGCKLDNVKYGYLVIAHGNDAEWNTAVTDACQPLLDLDNMLFSICFLEDPWGEAGDTFILPQEGYDQLVNRGAEQIIVVPLLVSSHSVHIDEVKFVTNLGPLDDPEPEILDVVIVESSAPIVGITKAVDGHPAIGRELAPRVLSVDDDPSLDNYIVLISHGASTDEEDIYWYHDLDNILTELEANLTDDFATDTHVITLRVHDYPRYDERMEELRQVLDTFLNLGEVFLTYSHIRQGYIDTVVVEGLGFEPFPGALDHLSPDQLSRLHQVRDGYVGLGIVPEIIVDRAGD